MFPFWEQELFPILLENLSRLAKLVKFGVYYADGSFEAAFLETLVRDAGNQKPGLLLLSAADLDDFIHVAITVPAPLDLIDLRCKRSP